MLAGDAPVRDLSTMAPMEPIEPTLLSALLAAAREFNSGRYFEAHEALEEALEDVPDPLWPLFLGLIQVSVGYHKVTQPGRPGAARMLEKGLDKLAPLPGAAGGVDLDRFRERARRDLDRLRAGRFDPDELARRPPRLIVRKRAR